MRSRLTYSNVMATVAVFVALGGSSYAAIKITGADVRNGSLTGKDIKRRSVPLNRLTATLPAGKRGPQGERGLQGAKGDKGDKGDTGSVDTSLFYSKSDSDSRFLPRSGQVLISVPPGGWTFEDPQLSENDAVMEEREQEFDYGPGMAELRAHATLPVTLGTRPLALRGAELCYDASHAYATLDQFELRVYRTTSDLDAGPASVLTSATDFDDEGCRTFSFIEPLTLSADDHVVPVVTGKWTVTGGPFSLGRLTLILEHT